MTFRLIDANLNRAREGLRVLEDAARFIHNAPDLSADLKSIRHSLSQVFQRFASELMRARDVQRDHQRRDRRPRLEKTASGLAAANFKRVQEALRSLEEAILLVDPAIHPTLMSLRFKTYQLEQRLARRTQLLAPLEDARLYVILDPDLCRHSPQQVCKDLVRGGADMIQLRAPQWTDRRLFGLASALRPLIQGPLFIINDRPHIAKAVHADGVHIGKTDLPIPAARRIVGDFVLIGATTHSAAEARHAKRQGADYLSYGPVFYTPMKPQLKPAGFSYLPQIRKLGLPFFPIGGINADNIGRLASRGVHRAVVCSAILSSPDPLRATRALKRRLTSSPSP